MNVPFKNVKFVKLHLTLQTCKEKQQELKISHHTFRALWSRHKKSGRYCDRSPSRRSFWTVIHSEILFIDFFFFFGVLKIIFLLTFVHRRLIEFVRTFYKYNPATQIRPVSFPLQTSQQLPTSSAAHLTLTKQTYFVKKIFNRHCAVLFFHEKEFNILAGRVLLAF